MHWTYYMYYTKILKKKTLLRFFVVKLFHIKPNTSENKAVDHSAWCSSIYMQMQQLKLYQEPYVCLAEHKRTKHKVREKRWSQLHLDLLVQILVSSAVITSTTINFLLQQLTDAQDEIHRVISYQGCFMKRTHNHYFLHSN